VPNEEERHEKGDLYHPGREGFRGALPELLHDKPTKEIKCVEEGSRQQVIQACMEVMISEQRH
jgi:hypothetical protein